LSPADRGDPGGPDAPRLERVHLLLGPELGEKNEYARKIVSRAAAEAGSAPEVAHRYLPETRPSEIVSEMRNGSLFSSCRVFYYQGVEQLGAKAEIAVLADYMASPADDVILILLSDQSYVDKPLSAAAGAARTKIFWELFEDRKEDWIRAFFRKRGHGVEEDAVQAILELVENNTEALKEECSRLALFLEPGAGLTEDVVEAYVSHNRSEDAFSLFDRMGSSGIEEALETLEKILYSKEGEPIAVLAGLQWCFAKLESFETLLASGMPAEEALIGAGLKFKKKQKLYRQASSRYPLPVCRRILARLPDADAELRSAPAGTDRLILQVLVYETMTKEGRAIEAWEA
jgi:DNA polymerase-3 subunit delta